MLTTRVFLALILLAHCETRADTFALEGEGDTKTEKLTLEHVVNSLKQMEQRKHAYNGSYRHIKLSNTRNSFNSKVVRLIDFSTDASNGQVHITRDPNSKEDASNYKEFVFNYNKFYSFKLNRLARNSQFAISFFDANGDVHVQQAVGNVLMPIINCQTYAEGYRILEIIKNPVVTLTNLTEMESKNNEKHIKIAFVITTDKSTTKQLQSSEINETSENVPSTYYKLTERTIENSGIRSGWFKFSFGPQWVLESYEFRHPLKTKNTLVASKRIDYEQDSNGIKRPIRINRTEHISILDNDNAIHVLENDTYEILKLDYKETGESNYELNSFGLQNANKIIANFQKRDATKYLVYFALAGSCAIISLLSILVGRKYAFTKD